MEDRQIADERCEPASDRLAGPHLGGRRSFQTR
jgi:hypothetical protein